MNIVILTGRLTKDPETRYSQNEDSSAVTRYTLAVERRAKKKEEAEADFVNCVCFGKTAEFAEQYLIKGIKIAVRGRIRTGSYTNREGKKVFTTDVVVEEHEFCEKKANSDNQKSRQRGIPPSDGFMNIGNGMDDELPFN